MTSKRKSSTHDHSGGGQIEARPTRAGLRQVGRQAGEVIATVREKGEAVIENTREKTYRAAAETNRLFQEHPIAAVAAAAAAGAVIAIFVPQLAVMGKAGAMAGKAGDVARKAVRSAPAREAAQVVLAGFGRKEKATVRRAVGKAAIAVGDRVRARRSRKGVVDDS